jgi:uncharacterized membrane protein YccC
MPEPEVGSVGKPDLQILLQDLAEARRDIHEERRNSARVIAGERERARWEIERLKKESDEKVKTFEKENEALARALGRIQAEIDGLRLENAVLKSNGKAAPVAPVTAAEKPAESTPGSAPGMPAAQVGGPVGTPLGAPKVTIIPPSGPALGKVPIRPEGGETV